jgi:hypothetical protein
LLGFHPLFDSDYRGWLRSSPWNARKALPLGPIHLVPQDALLLGLIVLLQAYQPVLPRAAIPLAMFAAYLAVLLIALVYTGPTWAAYVLAFGLAVAGRCLWWSPSAALIALLPVVVFSQFALTRSLARFPWTERLQNIRAATAFAYDKRDPASRLSEDWPLEVELSDIVRLWPRSVLDARRRERMLGRFDFVLISLLAGFGVYSATVGLPLVEETSKVLIALVVAVASNVAIVRIGIYTAMHHPPISLWGRFVTGQWIIPAYDVVVLTPLACVAAAFAVYLVASSLQLSFAITLGSVVTTTLLVALLGGPTKRRWQLTCPCRLAVTRVRAQTAEQI